CLPRRARRRSLGRAGDEDPQGARVLRTGACEGEVLSSGAPAVPGAASVAGIVPRWEWRTFGESFGAAEGLLDLREAERVQESDELYLLSQESDASVKVRDGLIDVKRLEAVDGQGLEPVRFAVIDVGTNSVKLHVGERRADDSWQTVADRAEVTRLGEGLQDTGSLQPEPLRRTADAVVGMVEEARRAGAAEIAAVA